MRQIAGDEGQQVDQAPQMLDHKQHSSLACSSQTTFDQLGFHKEKTENHN
jgi:hypothetical protein